MNAVAQILHDRACVADPQHDPHLLHGMLLLLEEGISPSTIGLAIGQSSTAVRALANQARNGDCRRASAWMGERHFSSCDADDGDEDAGAQLITRHQMFPVGWYRAVIALLVTADGASSQDVREIAERFGVLSAESKMMRRLRVALARQGLSMVIRSPGTHQVRYLVEGSDMLRLESIMADRWMEVRP